MNKYLKSSCCYAQLSPKTIFLSILLSDRCPQNGQIYLGRSKVEWNKEAEFLAIQSEMLKCIHLHSRVTGSGSMFSEAQMEQSNQYLKVKVFGLESCIPKRSHDLPPLTGTVHTETISIPRGIFQSNWQHIAHML